MPVRCLIVDDEAPAIDLMRRHINQIEDLSIIAECNSAVKAFDLLKKEAVDLIFLDIQMPILTGLDFVRALKDAPKIVLTTAYRDYAVEAYDLDIVDYLLKPISFDRFFKSVERYYQRLGKTTATFTSEPPSENKQHFYVNINKKNHKIIFSDILYIESLKDYVRIHTSRGKHTVKGNIGSILHALPASDFTRIHRSYIVPKQQITAFGASEVELGEIHLPIGPSYKDKLLKELNS